ncbi:MAG: RagB/SusD family nutrient uptake outer membrane protein [Bacteroidales bacterium]
MTILFLILLMSFFACDVLDVEPTQSISTENALTTKTGVQQALTGCYDALQYAGYYGRNFILAGEFTSDNGLPTGTIKEYKELANNSLLADNAVIEGIWNEMYTAVNRANHVIWFAPGVKDLTGAELNDILGQARFLRALHHFNLMNLFGPVPMRKEPSLSAGPSLNAGRAPILDLFEFIEEDLLFAETHITNSNKAMATATAAKALLARVYLYREDWIEARNMAEEVINSGGCQLVNPYAILFGAGTNPESIMHIEFDAQDKNRLAEYFLPTSSGGRKEISPSASLIASFEPGDERLGGSIANPAGEAYGVKYTDISTGTDKVYILRLAEMYLIRAEAEARLNGNLTAIRADVDTVRSRAGLGGTSAATHTDLLIAIERERRNEFAFEGHRWPDLVRTKRALDFKSTVTQLCQLLYPIPLSEIQTNEAITPADQNPCY